MNIDWLNDRRKVPDEVMSYVRMMAVQAVVEEGMSPEMVIKAYRISRGSFYRWLDRYRWGGYEALITGKAVGAPGKITDAIDQWLREVVLENTPMDYGYETLLWTREILCELINEIFGIQVGLSTIGNHLHALGLTSQRPDYQAKERDPAAVKDFVERKFPAIQRLAARIGADIAFEDEAGVGLQTHYGRTWGESGKTPKLIVTGKKGGLNLLSTVNTEGQLHFAITDQTLNSARYIEYLKDLLEGRDRPLILIVDKASFHTSAEICAFVRENRKTLRLFFLPGYAPELNPDEQVGNEIKVNKIGRQSSRDLSDLAEKLSSAMEALKQNVERVRSFFQLPETKYAST